MDEKSQSELDREGFNRFVVSHIKNGFEIEDINTLVMEEILKAVKRGELRLVVV